MISSGFQQKCSNLTIFVSEFFLQNSSIYLCNNYIQMSVCLLRRLIGKNKVNSCIELDVTKKLCSAVAQQTTEVNDEREKDVNEIIVYVMREW